MTKMTASWRILLFTNDKRAQHTDIQVYTKSSLGIAIHVTGNGANGVEGRFEILGLD